MVTSDPLKPSLRGNETFSESGHQGSGEVSRLDSSHTYHSRLFLDERAALKSAVSINEPCSCINDSVKHPVGPRGCEGEVPSDGVSYCPEALE